MRARNFHAAAVERGVTQGAVSQHLSKLETALGVALIVREPRACRPTPEGEEFLSYAERLLRLSDNAIATLRERHIAFGASSNIGIYLLQPYLKAYLSQTGGRHPVDLQIDQNPVIARKLDAGEIDVAAMEWWDDRPGYIARPWRREELVVIVSPDHPWAGLSCVTRALLKDAPLLAGEAGTGTARVLARYFGDGANELQISMRLGSTEAVKQGVKVGLGVSLVLAGTVDDEKRDGSLVAIPLEDEPPCKDLYLIWRASLRDQSPPRRLVDWLFEQSVALPTKVPTMSVIT